MDSKSINSQDSILYFQNVCKYLDDCQILNSFDVEHQNPVRKPLQEKSSNVKSTTLKTTLLQLRDKLNDIFEFELSNSEKLVKTQTAGKARDMCEVPNSTPLRTSSSYQSGNEGLETSRICKYKWERQSYQCSPSLTLTPTVYSFSETPFTSKIIFQSRNRQRGTATHKMDNTNRNEAYSRSPHRAQGISTETWKNTIDVSNSEIFKTEVPTKTLSTKPLPVHNIEKEHNSETLETVLLTKAGNSKIKNKTEYSERQSSVRAQSQMTKIATNDTRCQKLYLQDIKSAQKMQVNTTSSTHADMNSVILKCVPSNASTIQNSNNLKVSLGSQNVGQPVKSTVKMSSKLHSKHQTHGLRSSSKIALVHSQADITSCRPTNSNNKTCNLRTSTHSPSSAASARKLQTPRNRFRNAPSQTTRNEVIPGKIRKSNMEMRTTNSRRKIVPTPRAGPTKAEPTVVRPIAQGTPKLQMKTIDAPDRIINRQNSSIKGSVFLRNTKLTKDSIAPLSQKLVLNSNHAIRSQEQKEVDISQKASGIGSNLNAKIDQGIRKSSLNILSSFNDKASLSNSDISSKQRDKPVSVISRESQPQPKIQANHSDSFDISDSQREASWTREPALTAQLNRQAEISDTYLTSGFRDFNIKTVFNFL